MRETTESEKRAKGSEIIVEHTGFDPCVGPGESRENPLLVSIENVPYGAWFKCNQCGCIARSTFSFDCYGEVGELLRCEYCVQKGIR